MVKVNAARAKKAFMIGPCEAYVFNSTTEEGAYYIALVIPEDEDTDLVVCNCKGFRFNTKCWHMDYIIEQSEFNNEPLDVQTVLAELAEEVE